MNEITSWTQTAAGMIRRGGVIPETATVERAQDITAQDRLTAKRAFDDAWGPVITVQQALRDAGWSGAWIHVGDTIAPELRPLHAGAALNGVQSGIDAPGHRDPLVLEHDRIVRERLDAAEARLGPLARTVG